MSDIDWNVELRKIVREYDGLPPEPSPAEIRAQKQAVMHARAAERVARIGAWARLALVVALAAALYWWPNAHACGPDLFAFLAAEGMVAIGGLWIAAFTWRHRLGASHSLALVLLVTGLVLVAAQVLPRLGYATIAGVQADRWSCYVGAAGNATR